MFAEATRLHRLAASLTTTDPRIQTMAALPPGLWTDAHVAAAQEALDPARAAPTPRRVSRAPFVYDHTIDGLRGIPVSELESVDDKLAERFTKYGVSTVYDLLTHVPLRYENRSNIKPLAQCRVGEKVTFIGTVTAARRDKTKTGMRLAEITVKDGDAEVTCSFFRQAWKAGTVHPGDEVIVVGKLDAWTSAWGKQWLQMSNPLLERTGSRTLSIIPIYPQSKTVEVTTWQLHRATREAVERLGELSDPIPADMVAGGPHILDRATAYQQMHLPARAGDETTGRNRLAYDELLRLQLSLQMRRLAQQNNHGISHAPTGQLTGQLLASLPYQLTGAQQRALATITTDMRKPQPSHTLAQGDVGSGKTLVAVLLLLAAVEGGYQGALMAPTEILATQHYHELAERLSGITRPDGSPLRVELLTTKVRKKMRDQITAALAAGLVDVVVGTHALLSTDVKFAQLGLVVVDEQHRFGVEQRAALTHTRGDTTAVPDLVVMTATPIPRTAAMTTFGDLKLVVIDELPPGRTPIATRWVPVDVSPAGQDEVWDQVCEQVAAGRQAYVVCPLVEDSETKAAASAEATRQQLSDGPLAGLRVGIVHGKQKPDERDQMMAQFKAGEIDVLVATTVIEVGVNVPNATIIVILGAKSFGIAQLHQLRGRVGRGQHPGHCVLVTEAGSDETAVRMEALVNSTSGFELSEVDLMLRGPGAILGNRQSGASDLRVADLLRDTDLLMLARDDAATLLANDPTLARRPGLAAEVRNALGEDAEKFLTAS